MKKILTVITAALLLAACTEAPEDVKSRTEQKNEVQSAAQTASGTETEKANTELIKVPVSELAADAEKAIAQKYSNFTFREGLRVKIPEKLILCDFEQVSLDLSEAEKYAGLCFSEEELAKVTLTEDNWSAIKDEYRDAHPELIYRLRGFHDEEAGLHFSYGSNGFLCMMDPLGIEGTMNHEARRTDAIFRLNRGEDLSASYILGEDTEPTAVKEAAETAEKWLNEVYADHAPYYTFAISSVAAKEDDRGQYFYSIKAEIYYKGIPLNSFGFKQSEAVISDEDGSMLRKDLETQWELRMLMYRKGEINYFTNGSGVIEPKEKGELTEAVSVSSAMKYLEKTFTDFNEPFRISDIRLRYSVEPDYQFTLTGMHDNSGVKSTGRLLWEFTSDIPVSGSCGDSRRYITVDAETGELDFNFDLNQGLLKD